MKYSLHASFEDVSTAEDVPVGVKMLEGTKGARFGRYSRVCRRLCSSLNGLHKIPENEVPDFRRIVCSPRMELILASKSASGPPGTNAQNQTAPTNKPKEDIRKRRGGFWGVFKSKSGSEKRKNHQQHHHVDAASLLNFV